jgi:hypothetical protein
MSEKSLKFTTDEEDALLRDGACAKWKYLLACGLGRDLRQVGTECRRSDNAKMDSSYGFEDYDTNIKDEIIKYLQSAGETTRA